MRYTKKAATLVAAAALLAGGAVAAGAGTASAVTTPKVEGNFSISAPGCHIVEGIALQGSPKHDYMRWVTTSSSTGCWVRIVDGPAQVENQDNLAAGYHSSKWYYDGPGHTDQVQVYSPQTHQWYLGRAN